MTATSTSGTRVTVDASSSSPTLTDEQLSLREATRGVFGTHAGRDARRAYVDQGAGFDPTLWRVMSRELGLHSILIDAERGGAGGTLLDMTVVLEEAGAELLCGPFMATAVLGASAITASEDDDAKSELLPAIADGDLVCAVCLPPASVVAEQVSSGRDGWTLTGSATNVINGADADMVIVAADTEDGLAMFTVSADAAGLRRDEHLTLDRTRRLATVTFTGARARCIAMDGQRAWSSVLRTARVAVAAEQVGAAQRCLDTTVDYASSRHQFGRPIGSQQAVKHRCADVYVGVTSARAVVQHAAWVAAADPADAEITSYAAGSVASVASVRAATDAIQVHGGIGYTWEHDAHLYLKRALSSARILETVAEQREQLAPLIGL